MKKQSQVLGRCAPSPRITKTAALLVATGLSVPVFILLTLAEFLFF